MRKEPPKRLRNAPQQNARSSANNLLSEYDQCAAIGRDYAMHANEFAAMSYYAAQLQALSA